MTRRQGGSGEPEPPERLPRAFPNFRIGPDGLFSADFYHDIADPLFAQLFLERVRFFTTGSPMYVRLRSTPFFFTACPGCSIVILTNRPADRTLRCRQCGYAATAPLAHLHGPQTEAVLTEVDRLLGRRPRATVGYLALVSLQLPGPGRAREAAEHCREAGFQFIPADHPQVLLLRMLNQDRRVPDERAPGQQAPETVYAVRRYPGGSVVDPTVTPPEVEALTSTLRTHFGPVLSLSATCELRADDPLTLLLTGDLTGCETLLTCNPAASGAAGGWWVVLSRFSFLTGDLEGALRQAGQAILLAPCDAQGWFVLGEAQLGLSRIAEARDSLTTAQRYDPADFQIPAALAKCHHLLGNHAAEREKAERAVSLGCPYPPGCTSRS